LTEEFRCVLAGDSFEQYINNNNNNNNNNNSTAATRMGRRSLPPRIEFFHLRPHQTALQSFKTKLEDESKQFVASMILSGRHNPYMRHSRFLPPLHLNFNYMIDPRAAITNMEFNPLYDEHKAGVYESRAAPLEIPEVAVTHFDPDNPNIKKLVPKEQTEQPVWKTVYDYFTHFG
jgi:hypothetical protein